MTDREKEWAAYRAWKKDFRGPIYFQHWDQWIAEYGFACWQASRRAALEEAANHITRGVEGAKQNGWIDAANERLRCAVAIRKLATETNHE